MRTGLQTLPLGYASPIRINSGLEKLKTGKWHLTCNTFSEVRCCTRSGSYREENMLLELIFPMEGREKGIKGVSVRGRGQIFYEEVLK